MKIIKKRYSNQGCSVFVELYGNHVNYEIRLFWKKNRGWFLSAVDCIVKPDQNGFECTEYLNLLWAKKPHLLFVAGDNERFSKKKLQKLASIHLNLDNVQFQYVLEKAKWNYEDNENINKYQIAA